METGDGSRVAKKRFMAQKVAEVVATGMVTLPNGRELVVSSFDEYFDVVRWAYKHIDGDRQTVDVTSNGQSIVTRIEVAGPADSEQTAVPS